MSENREWTPAEHYAEGVVKLEGAMALMDNDPMMRTNALLEALAHGLLGALRADLDWHARQPSPPAGTGYAPPRIEEDFEDDRP